MNTPATQPTDLDKRLEEKMAARSGEAKYLYAALLRARQFLHAIQGAPNVPTLEAAEELAKEGCADPELEELLR